jgi:drug/metabolite transporter (DMT)-like permease
VTPPSPPSPFLARTKASLWKNRGLFLILISQFFGSLMALTARLLETTPERFHALQILFVRQTITAAACFLWMWWNQVPDAPLGARGVRWLLVLRGLGGFWGVFGLYYSLTYLDLSDATVITFLVPVVATFACSLIPSLKEPFTKHEFLAGVVSFLGVVLIARPASFFSKRESANDAEEATPQQRLVAVMMALLGVLGAC